MSKRIDGAVGRLMVLHSLQAVGACTRQRVRGGGGSLRVQRYRLQWCLLGAHQLPLTHTALSHSFFRNFTTILTLESASIVNLSLKR
ncbi:unnamed protein product [Spodoptera littoralis]|uniref:Uncharacterized protein n=1 Tax=Spodoptera littoralis TaxID=7109 RepID=A0A9P0IJA5_SPOLI|nr:unnamed protein product [Spodoptera littoralis]CAH1647930.1 unnamed protein product [Spodoptera littoralis]